ncbi:diadenylate cyclase CdaA [Sediminitomix flava]|uniref:Diadenylate cyclase n=1 Tax=Sediminitomix flava TaxID=379075 RepID=A0A315ZEQ1_SEDFL|nr:diadenylate cyclase CdaA [Sediminitomix flava]PWJ44076.1 uncharacterized protein (TIGR00159 family) [Sediminitomix flava]
MLLFSIGFLEVNIIDIIDILLVTILLFNLYKLIRKSIALKIFVGFLSVYLIYLVVRATNMGLLTEILGQFMEVGVLAAIILFQQEIRKFLLFIGRHTEFDNLPLIRSLRFGGKSDKKLFEATPIVDAMREMGKTNTGALIVLSKEDDLPSVTETGDLLDAQLSKRLLLSVFFKNSPLHDGGAVIYNNRLVAARCILPVSENPNISATLGLRHRAAIGLTETSSAVVLVVSEETGQLSFVKNGKIFQNLSGMEVRKHIKDYLLDTYEVN